MRVFWCKLTFWENRIRFLFQQPPPPPNTALHYLAVPVNLSLALSPLAGFTLPHKEEFSDRLGCPRSQRC